MDDESAADCEAMNAARAACAEVDAPAAAVLHPALGRTLMPSDDQRGCAGAAVLSYRLWRREYGGRPDILGKVARDASLEPGEREALLTFFRRYMTAPK